MQWLFTKLKYFDSEQAQFLVYTVTKEKVNALTEDQLQSVQFLFSRIDEETTDASLKAIVDCIAQAFIYNERLSVYRVNEGEDFGLVITKNDTDDDYTPNILVAREHLSGTILTQQQALETNSQTLRFFDLDLTAGQVYKIRIQLEEPATATTTSGNAVSELTTVFFVVINDIDSE